MLSVQVWITLRENERGFAEKEDTMFSVGGPEAFWLNVANIVLGLVTVIAFVAVFGGALVEVVERLRQRAPARSKFDVHSLTVPVLGPTMADGGDKMKEHERHEENEEN